jgi:hypothetical protein
MHLSNSEPTQTEIKMFKYAGLYLFAKTEDSLTYLPVHTDKYPEFETELEYIDVGAIEFDNYIKFDLASQTVQFIGNQFFDRQLLDLIVKRSEELGFK